MHTSVAPHCSASRDFCATSSSERGCRVARTHAEGAELAPDETNVGEIDVAGDDVADYISHQPPPDFVGRNHQPEDVVAGAVSEQHTFVAREHTAIERGEDLLQRCSDLRGKRAAARHPILHISEAPADWPNRGSAYYRNKSFSAGRTNCRALPLPRR